MKDSITGLRGIHPDDKRFKPHFWLVGFVFFCFVFAFMDTVKMKGEWPKKCLGGAKGILSPPPCTVLHPGKACSQF